jgi:hypothetical protein
LRAVACAASCAGAGPFARLSASICTAISNVMSSASAPRDRHVRGAVGDVRAEAAVLDADRLAAHGSASNSLSEVAARFAYFGCA